MKALRNAHFGEGSLLNPKPSRRQKKQKHADADSEPTLFRDIVADLAPILPGSCWCAMNLFCVIEAVVNESRKTPFEEPPHKGTCLENLVRTLNPKPYGSLCIIKSLHCSISMETSCCNCYAYCSSSCSSCCSCRHCDYRILNPRRTKMVETQLQAVLKAKPYTANPKP